MPPLDWRGYLWLAFSFIYGPYSSANGIIFPSTLPGRYAHHLLSPNHLELIPILGLIRFKVLFNALFFLRTVTARPFLLFQSRTSLKFVCRFAWSHRHAPSAPPFLKHCIAEYFPSTHFGFALCLLLLAMPLMGQYRLSKSLTFSPLPGCDLAMIIFIATIGCFTTSPQLLVFVPLFDCTCNILIYSCCP
jgi:hypothetical protein